VPRQGNQPLVTIGIPNYNYARFLEQCVGSALGQDHAELEVLVSDNASTDGSCDLLASIKDSRLRWWRNPSNLGVYPNWDGLLRQARGRYVKILQADDWLEPDFVSGCLEAMRLTGADSAMTGFRFSGAREGLVLPSQAGLPGQVCAPTRAELARAIWELTCFVQPTPTLFHRDLVPEGYGGGSTHMSRDFVYWAKAVVRGRPVFIDRPLAVQRIHSGQDRRRKDNSQGLGDLLAGIDELRVLEAEGAGAALEAMQLHFGAQFFRSAVRHFLSGRWSLASRLLSELRRRGLLAPAAARAIAMAAGLQPVRRGSAMAAL